MAGSGKEVTYDRNGRRFRVPFSLPPSRFPLPASRFPLPASRFPLPAKKKPRTLVGYGAGYWWPTRPTSSTSSSILQSRRGDSGLQKVRLTLRQNGLKDSFNFFAAEPPDFLRARGDDSGLRAPAFARRT